VKFALITQLGEDQLSELEQSNKNLKTRTTESQIREKDLRQLERAEPPEADRRKPWKAAIAGLGALLGLVGVILSQTADGERFGLPLLILGGLMVVGSLLIQGRRSPAGSEGVIRERERAHDRHVEGIKGVEEAQRILNENLKSAGLTTWDEFQTSLDQVRTLESEINSAAVALSAFLAGNETMEDLVDKREKASRERRDSEESLQDLAEAPQLSAKEFQELVNKLEDLKNEREDLRDQITRREVILEEPDHNVEDLHQLEERRASTQRTLDQNREQADIYRFVLEGLEEARQETLRTAKDELEPRLGTYLLKMTQGKYETAFVDDDLAIRVLHAGVEESVKVEDLSRGTQDQVYLAARLALSDLVFHDAHPPLLMDDPFVTFDPQRKQAALELCKRLAVDRQIILFTCHEGYASFADNLIELD
jgi:DNA repair exonuclease SbcCD ATPase subunit